MHFLKTWRGAESIRCIQIVVTNVLKQIPKPPFLAVSLPTTSDKYSPESGRKQLTLLLKG